MTDVTAIELTKDTGRDKEEARRETTHVISGRHMATHLAPAPVEQALRRPGISKRQVYGIQDLPREIAESIQKSKMSAAHNHLNELMK